MEGIYGDNIPDSTRNPKIIFLSSRIMRERGGERKR